MQIGELLFFPGAGTNLPRKKQISYDGPSAIGPVVRSAKKSGFSRDTIRFYEKIGLIKLEEDDWRNRYQSRDYSEGVLRRLIRHIDQQINELMAVKAKLQEVVDAPFLHGLSHRAGAIFNELLNSALSIAMMGKKI